MCYYFKETQTISKLLTIAMVVILIVGIIGGIAFGFGLRRYVGYADYEWTSTGTIVMITMWVSSVISALSLYITKHLIELSDMTAGALQNIQKNTIDLLKNGQK